MVVDPASFKQLTHLKHLWIGHEAALHPGMWKEALKPLANYSLKIEIATKDYLCHCDWIE